MSEMFWGKYLQVLLYLFHLHKPRFTRNGEGKWAQKVSMFGSFDNDNNCSSASSSHGIAEFGLGLGMGVFRYTVYIFSGSFAIK